MSGKAILLSARRNQLIRSVQNQQREQIKNQLRISVLNSVCHGPDVFKLSQQLKTYNIQYFPLEVHKILHQVRNYIHHPDFEEQFQQSDLLDELINRILGELNKKTYLSIPSLVEELLQFFVAILHKNYFQKKIHCVSLLLVPLQKYPLNHQIVNRVATILAYLQMTSHQSMPEVSFDRDFLIYMVELYLTRQKYEIWEGPGYFTEIVQKGEQRWLSNAVSIMQIANSLLIMSPQRQQILKTPSLGMSLVEGLNICLSTFYFPLNESEKVKCQPLHTYQDYITIHEQWDYLQTLILDTFILREQLITSAEIEILKKLLEKQLCRFQHRSVARNVVRILKILYEQVIMDEDDLRGIVEKCNGVGPYVDSIISSDFL